MDGVRAPHIMTDSTDNERPEKMTHARSEYRDFMSLTPDAYAAVLALGQVAAKAGMDKQLLELIKLRASQINGCAFCVQYHIMESEKLGVPADKLNLVVVWREAPQFSPRERAALAWTEALTLISEGVSDEVYAQASTRILREGTCLSHVGGRLDQCLEQVRRSLPLDPAGTQAGCRSGGLVSVNKYLGEAEDRRCVGSRLANAGRGSGQLFLLNSAQILDDLQDSFFYNHLRVARHIEQRINRLRLVAFPLPARRWFLSTSPNGHFEPAMRDCASAIHDRCYCTSRKYTVVILGESRQIGGLAFQFAAHRARALAIRTVALRAF